MATCTMHTKHNFLRRICLLRSLRLLGQAAAFALLFTLRSAAAFDGIPPNPNADRERNAQVAAVTSAVAATQGANAPIVVVVDANQLRDNPEFKAVTSGGETYRGGTLLTVAYMLFFVLMFVWIALVWSSQARAERLANALDVRLDAAARSATAGVAAPTTTSSE